MTKLTHENFIKARDYIYANSDDINRAWFRYNFEDHDTASFEEWVDGLDHHKKAMEYLLSLKQTREGEKS